MEITTLIHMHKQVHTHKWNKYQKYVEDITRDSIGVKEMLFISICYANNIYILDGMEKILEGKHKLLNFRERRKETILLYL